MSNYTTSSDAWHQLENNITSLASPQVAAHLTQLLQHPQVKTRLLTAPASSKRRYHHAHVGGLLAHINEIIELMTRLKDTLNLEAIIPPVNGITTWDQLLLCAILHDFNKLGGVDGTAYYVPNILKSGKVSEAEPFAVNDDWFKAASIAPVDAAPEVQQARILLHAGLDQLAEGDISLSMVGALVPHLYVSLPESVRFAIKHHDGMYGKARRELSSGGETALQQILHFADMWSSRLERWQAAAAGN